MVSTFRTLKSNIGQDSIIQALLQSDKQIEDISETKEKKEDTPTAGMVIDPTLKQQVGQQVTQNQSIKVKKIISPIISLIKLLSLIAYPFYSSLITGVNSKHGNSFATNVQPCGRSSWRKNQTKTMKILEM